MRCNVIFFSDNVMSFFFTTSLNCFQVVSNITSEEWAQSCFSQINDSYTINDPEFYGADYAEEAKDHGTAHVSILAPNGDAVAATSTVNLV